MNYLRGLWCRWRGHELIAGFCLPCRGLRAISGGQDDFLSFASDMGGAAEASQAGGAMATGAGEGMGIEYAPGTRADTPAPSGGGFWNFAKQFGQGAGSAIAESPLKSLTAALGLGVTGLGISNQLSAQKQLGQQTKMLRQGQQQTQAAGQRSEAVAAPAAAFGTETLTRAAGGNLTPALQAGIDQWVQKAKADVTARFASMGLGNSTQIESALQMVDQQASAMKGKMLQEQESTGLAGIQTGVSAAGVSAGAGANVAGAADRQQAQLAQLIQQADQQLGQMAGRAA